VCLWVVFVGVIQVASVVCGLPCVVCSSLGRSAVACVVRGLCVMPPAPPSLLESIVHSDVVCMASAQRLRSARRVAGASCSCRLCLVGELPCCPAAATQPSSAVYCCICCAHMCLCVCCCTGRSAGAARSRLHQFFRCSSWAGRGFWAGVGWHPGASSYVVMLPHTHASYGGKFESCDLAGSCCSLLAWTHVVPSVALWSPSASFCLRKRS
jgi:hypothetical protein